MEQDDYTKHQDPGHAAFLTAVFHKLSWWSIQREFLTTSLRYAGNVRHQESFLLRISFSLTAAGHFIAHR
jgi:hypothetical protein